MTRNEFFKLAAFSGLGIMLTFPVLGADKSAYSKLKSLLEAKLGQSLDEEYATMNEMKNELIAYNNENKKYISLADKYTNELYDIIQAEHDEIIHYLKYEAVDVQTFIKNLVRNDDNKIVMNNDDFDFTIRQIKKLSDIGIQYGSVSLKEELQGVKADIDKLYRRGYENAINLVSEKSGLVSPR